MNIIKRNANVRNQVSRNLLFCLVLLSAAFVVPSAFSADRVWYMQSTGWWSTPEEACEAHHIFLPSGGWTNPRVDEVPPGGGGTNPSYRYCFGTSILHGHEQYFGYIRAYGCTGISKTSTHYHLCLINDADEADKTTGGGTCSVGNPCDVATGNKFQSEVDFEIGSLTYQRSYNSANIVDLRAGLGWRTNWHKALYLDGSSLRYTNATGRGEDWVNNGVAWVGDPDSKVSIVNGGPGYILTHQNGVVENYDAFGRIVSEVDTFGKQTLYAYDADGKLLSVTGKYGNSISFEYEAGRISKVSTSAGHEYIYEYDGKKNLKTVIYPDNTANDLDDNPRRTYLYENAPLANHLTGIIDENQQRYATWAYDADGRAVSSEHAQTSNSTGQQKFLLDRDPSN